MATPTSLFTSDRERRLWCWALAVVVAIYSTLGLAGTLAEVLRENNLMRAAFFFLMFLTVAAIVGSGLKTRPGRVEVWVALGHGCLRDVGDQDGRQSRGACSSTVSSADLQRSASGPRTGGACRRRRCLRWS